MWDVSTNSNLEKITTISAGLLAFYIIFCLIIVVIAVVANWKIFTKAGKPGWAAIVPFYNLYTEFEIVGYNGWMFLLLLVPFVNIVIEILLCVRLAKAFGQGTGFALGLIFLSPIFLLILAFGNYKYVGIENK